VLVDTQGLMLHAIVHAADIQDRDGGGLLISTLFGLHPFLTRLYADAGYQGPRFTDAVKQATGGPLGATVLALRYGSTAFRDLPAATS